MFIAVKHWNTSSTLCRTAQKKSKRMNMEPRDPKNSAMNENPIPSFNFSRITK